MKQHRQSMDLSRERAAIEPRNSAIRIPVLALALSLLNWTATMAQPCPTGWDDTVGNPGLNSTVWCAGTAQGNSAIGPALYIGGQFHSAGGLGAYNIAKWDGTSWSPLGTGTQSSGTVYAIAASNSDGLLYVGGAFSNLGGQPGTRSIGVWNGLTWSDVGGGNPQMSNAGVRALAIYDGDLYAGGHLNQMGAATTTKLARWNGSAWSALTGDPIPGASNDVVEAMAVFDDDSGEALYVGGKFNDAGGNTNADNIFKWNGTTLEPLGRGTNNNGSFDAVEAMTVFNGELIVGGYFTEVYQIDGTVVTANRIAKWNGSTWSPLGTGMNTVAGYHVWALAAFDDGTGDALYAGGSFTTAGGVSVTKIAKWDGVSWSEISNDTSLNGYVYGLAEFSDTTGRGLYVGGTFNANDGVTTERIIQWRSASPPAPDLAHANPAEICPQEMVNVSAVATSGTIDWYTGGCGDTFIGSGQSILVFPLETTTYYARSRYETSGCESTTCDSVTVTVSEWCCDCLGDMTGDNHISGDDIQLFVDCMIGHSTSCGCVDFHGNQAVDLQDIALFVTALVNGTDCP